MNAAENIESALPAERDPEEVAILVRAHELAQTLLTPEQLQSSKVDDLDDGQCVAFGFAILAMDLFVSAKYPPPNGQPCGWCVEAAGDDYAAWSAAPRYQLEAIRAHTMVCQHNPLVRQNDELRRELIEAHATCDGSCDIALACRQVGPDGVVPGNARQCAELWEREAARLTRELAELQASRTGLPSASVLALEMVTRQRDDLSARLAAATDADGEPGSLARARVRAWSRLQDLNRIGDIVRVARAAGDDVDVSALLDQIEQHAQQLERAATVRQPTAPPPPSRSIKPCRRCGEHHLTNAFRPGERVIVDGKHGIVLEWSQYGGPLYVRVEFDERDENGDAIRANYDQCQISEEPF